MGLREDKKLATRQHISDVATKLFIERGFEQVTVDEVATAAGVAKMTVFNYFPRKEDLFFDRTEDLQALLGGALRGQKDPLAALEALVRDLVEGDHPVTRVNRDVIASWKAVAASPALRARAYDLLAELEIALAGMIGDRLVAAILLAAWRVAFAAALKRRSNKGLAEAMAPAFAAAACVVATR